jgi:hypothetical protein
MIEKATFAQVAGMAVLVASLLYFPVVGALAFLCFALKGVSLRAFITFGDTYAPFAGLLAWWTVGFVLALAYSAFVSRQA